MKKLINCRMRALVGELRWKKAGAAVKSHQQDSCMLAHWRDEEDGNALVEFAMTAPILVAVLVAIFQFGIVFNNQLTLTQAVGAGAQRLQTIRTATIANSDPCAAVLSVIEGAAPQLSPSSISLTVTMDGATGGNSCPGDQSDLVQGDPVTVNASYPCNISLYGFKFSSACQLTAQVTEYEY
jgi:Flp pilus assembly protein TadG